MSSADGLEALGAYRPEIDAALRRFFDEVPALLAVELPPSGRQALERLEAYCLRPAKRISGGLAALTYDAAAGTNHDAAAIGLGVVLELLQAYLLIIDDVMDRSPLRRGEAAMHELYRSAVSDPHIADMMAINIGMLTQHLASLWLAGIQLPPAQLDATSAILQRNIALTGFGQLEDISITLDTTVTEQEVITKYMLKSSYYTFVNPLQLGFALAGKADESLLASCESFGVAAGVAFQLHDDYLGMFGNAADLGKSTLDDLQEGKYTLLVQYALTHADPVSQKVLRSLLGNRQATADDLQTVQRILQASGAVEYCQSQALRYAGAAKQVLYEKAIGSAEFRQILEDIVDYSVSRER